MTSERWRRIEELYHSALERAPADRAALLAQADPALRREVEAMLAQDASGGKILDRPAEDLLTNSRSTMAGPGSQLGPYQVEALLGAGGMGEVYRAVDTRLNRKVAVKISTEQFSARFEREARAIAALNHPHICTLHDVGPNYLVMELVEGETLADRLQKGRLPMPAVLRYAAEIADALAAAHALGIIHRDLKPQNIMITKSGVKVLDFGLAKSPRDETLTATRVVMGTPAYMAPEQLEGKECDARSDIYALGLVLYEMATGKRLPRGQPPSMEGLPPQLAHVVERCLATEPENRWHSAKDVQFQLEVGTAILSPAMTSPAPRAPLAWVAAGGALVLAGGMTIWGQLHTPPGEPRPVTRWTATLPAAPFYGSGLSITRDGTRLAYGELTGSSPRIGVRLLDQFEGKAVPGAEGGQRPFFSPDGQWLAYFSGPLRALTLKKVPVTGGTPIALCEGARFEGGSWGEDNRIIFSGGSSRGLMQVSASGGTCESLTRGDLQKRENHVWPQILPGGRSVLFTIGTPGSFDSARVAVLDLRTRQYRVVVSGGSSARYVPSGHLVYARGGALFAVPFDLKRLAVTGSETPVIEGLYYNGAGGGFADYAFSDSGLLVYMTEQPATNLRTLEWMDRKGTSKVSAAPPADYQSVRLSPDEQRAAVEVRGVGRTFDIWILDLARGGLTRLTTEGSYFDPLWTRDSTHLLFGFGPPGRRGFHWAPTDGSGKPEMLLERQEGVADSWTPDGKTLLYHSVGPAHIWKSQPAVSGGDGKPRPLFEETSFNESDAQVSPDGQWLAYTSDESGKNRVYVRPFPGPGGKTPISIESGQEPRWSRGGPELFYRDPDKNQLMAVDIQTNPTLRAGQPHALFELGNVPWDVASNGKRFLVVKEPASSASEAKMQAVVNWFEELRQKAPKK